MSIELPAGLAGATVKTVVSVDWFQLSDYLIKAYAWPLKQIDMLEAGNDTDYDCSISDRDLEFAESRRQKIMGDVLGHSGVQEYDVSTLIALAVIDGKLPRADYLVRLSW